MITTLYIIFLLVLILIGVNFFSQNFRLLSNKGKIYLYLLFVIVLSIFSIISIHSYGISNAAILSFWAVVIACLLGVFYLVFQRKIAPILVDENPFKPINDRQIELFVKFLNDNSYCHSEDKEIETLTKFFELIFKGNMPITPIIWTHKFNNQPTYNGLICFFKLALKEDYYNYKFLKNMMMNLDINFESNKYRNLELKRFNEGSFRQAYEKLNFTSLNANQEKIYDELKVFFY